MPIFFNMCFSLGKLKTKKKKKRKKNEWGVGGGGGGGGGANYKCCLLLVRCSIYCITINKIINPIKRLSDIDTKKGQTCPQYALITSAKYINSKEASIEYR